VRDLRETFGVVVAGVLSGRSPAAIPSASASSL
jgi:hypothetical protein